MDNDIDLKYIFSSLANIFLVLLLAFGVLDKISMFFQIILVVITILNAGYLVYRSVEMLKEKKR